MGTLEQTLLMELSNFEDLVNDGENQDLLSAVALSIDSRGTRIHDDLNPEGMKFGDTGHTCSFTDVSEINVGTADEHGVDGHYWHGGYYQRPSPLGKLSIW